VDPPGGTLFTAILTDLEIGSRYLLNLVAPFGLSAVYFVDPIRELGDPRAAAFASLLIALVGMSLWLAPDRKLTVFLWLWLVGALGPSLNLVAIPHFMQDRYIYLSTPAFFLILWQAFAGLRQRAGVRLGPAFRIGAVAYVGMLVILAAQRSFVWDTAFSIFMDAVDKQPKAAYARFGLGMAYGQATEMEFKGGRHERVNEFRRHWMDQWRAAIDDCPDVTRFSFFCDVALNVGEDCQARGDLVGAEKYWRLAASPPPGVPEQAPARALALGWLASLRLSEGRLQEASDLAYEARETYPAEQTILIRGRTAIALAREKEAAGDLETAKALRERARIDLGLIPAWSKHAPIAAELLNSIPVQ